MSEFLFVYGTLSRDAGHPQHQNLAAHADYVGKGYFHGRLYRVAHYPGAVPSLDPGEKVFGELYSLRDADRLFGLLDDYEGCGPADPPP
ncbi:MAG: gamma-glutamylcyclotransferase family protein, partial [Sphingomicrobium sp.]